MGLKVILWTAQPKSDGTCPIKIYLNSNKKNKYCGLNLYCLPKDFDEKIGRVKRTRGNWAEMNSIISSTHAKFEKLMLENPVASVDTIVDLYEGGHRKGSGKIIPFAQWLYDECKDGRIDRKYNTYKKYLTVINHLKKYNPELKWKDIDKNFYNDFTSWLRNKEHSENTVGGVIKTLKVFINEAVERGITDIQEHKKKYFKTISEETDAIYLTNEELDKIIKLDLSKHPAHAEERDRFIVATYLLLRWSDSIRVTEANFEEKRIKNKTITLFKQRHQKTNNEVVIPVKPIVKTILKRNNYSLNFRGNNKANAYLEDIGKWAKIDNKIILNGKECKKYEAITTHTARRSGATNYYIATKNIKLIMTLGGWTTEKSFMKYIRITKEETALMATDHPIFR